MNLFRDYLLCWYYQSVLSSTLFILFGFRHGFDYLSTSIALARLTIPYHSIGCIYFFGSFAPIQLTLPAILSLLGARDVPKTCSFVAHSLDTIRNYVALDSMETWYRIHPLRQCARLFFFRCGCVTIKFSFLLLFIVVTAPAMACYMGNGMGNEHHFKPRRIVSPSI